MEIEPDDGLKAVSAEELSSKGSNSFASLPVGIENQTSNNNARYKDNDEYNFERRRRIADTDEINEDSEVEVINETSGLLELTSSRSNRSGIILTDSTIKGKSTASQTIFNSINVIIGIGKYLIGDKLNFAIFITFAFDLIGASLALILLFSDSFHTFFINVDPFIFKLIILCLVFGLSFLPLNILSIFSFIGIICTSGVVIIIFCAGFFKKNSPGSLLSPIFNKNYLWPKNINDLLISISIFMANYGGHVVLPEIISDMKRPAKEAQFSMIITFTFTWFIDLFIGLTGFLMFGSNVEDEITKNIMLQQGYPSWIPTIICLLMGLLPIAKLPIVTRPLISTFEKSILNIDFSKNENSRFIKKLLSRLFVYIFFLIISMIFTSFGKIMAFLGSAICFTVCVTLPLLFYLKIFKNKLSRFNKICLYIGVLVSCLFAISGTIASIMG
ncbi:hypothetical protein PACTADRAFT_1570 [Pachysolen tannophilus NRRL Y-2460]|uniref:Amino acid transporter transmembrane domain-containing protein n=1 Tax=Pachysolen tannophilus NRRL Y-2460 TaxID=669874 RepID=A0A1E4TZ19_PACTA|nr:hypothetical protein PACTADRAFT_1570 [Pachysolen tannophilus NRRL Y-2460]